MKKLVGQNARRAEWGYRAVEAYAAATHLNINPDADGLTTGIGDLLGSLIHLCEREGINFEEMMAKGRRYYQEETWAKCAMCKRSFDGDEDTSPNREDLCKECAPG